MRRRRRRGGEEEGEEEEEGDERDLNNSQSFGKQINLGE